MESRRGVYKYLHITATLTKIIVLSLSRILSILLPARFMDTRFLRHALSSREPSPPSVDHRASSRRSSAQAWRASFPISNQKDIGELPHVPYLSIEVVIELVGARWGREALHVPYLYVVGFCNVVINILHDFV